MKILQKLILPVLIIAAIFLVYEFYFLKGDDLGSYSDFDPNNNAVKEIRVQLLADRGIEQNGGAVIFFTTDRDGKIVQVSGELMLPEGFESAKVIILRGHLSQGGFHAHEVLLD
jgi:cytochrome c-type biogenesis protein CcmE